MKKFNINHNIYIQITDAGWDYLKQTVGDDYINNCIETDFCRMVIDGKVWYKLQCHHVFSILPINYGKVLFNTNIMIDLE